MKNNKGFTFVEILAVIAIIGILSGIAIIGVSRYRENAKNKDYEALARSAYNGMEEYMMKNPYKDKVSLETLADGNFISNRVDPATKNTDCSGSVVVETKTEGTNGVMDENEYKVHLCCTNYKKTYTYPEGNVTDLEDEDYCDYVDEDEEEGEIPPITPGEETTVKVTLNGNGGTTAGTGSVNVKVGDTKLTTITNPRKVVTITYKNTVGATVTGGDNSKSYTLNGWYTSATNGNKVATNANEPVLQKSVSGYTNASNQWIKTTNTTLYAQWANVTATLPTVTKTGYTCKWTTVDGGKTVERASGGSWTFSSANSRTFTAVCTSNSTSITVTFNCNGGKITGSSSTTAKQTLTTGVSGNKFNKSCTKTGYTQDGWKRNTGSSSREWTTNSNVTDNWIKTYASAITLYAHWTINSYTLRFNKQGGSGTCNNITKNYNVSWGSLCSPTKTGYTFGGWYTSANGGGTRITNTSKATQNLTVHAKWTPRIYTITLDNNGATTAGTSTIYLKYNTGWYSNSGATTNLSKITVPTKNAANSYSVDYNFKGYYTQKNGQGTQIINSNGNILSGKTTAISSNATLYAYWTKQGWNLANSRYPVLSQKWEYYNDGVKIQSGMHILCSSNRTCSNARPHYFSGGYAITGWKKINGNIYYFLNTDLDNNDYRDLRASCGGYLKVDGKWAYFDSNCHCKKGVYDGYNYQYCGGY